MSHHRLVATIAVAGGLLLFSGTALHPMQADPNDPAAAFAEYAADRLWVASHLTQLAGVALIGAALVLLADMMAGGPARHLARLGSAGAIASIASAAALQAVDGVALKKMVEMWAAAVEPDKRMIFYAAVGVRQIEVGLAGIMSLLVGVTFIVYGIAMGPQPYGRPWLTWLGIVGGGGLTAGGVVTAYTGFSSLAMNFSMLSTMALLIWLVGLAAYLWRSADSSTSR